MVRPGMSTASLLLNGGLRNISDLSVEPRGFRAMMGSARPGPRKYVDLWGSGERYCRTRALRRRCGMASQALLAPRGSTPSEASRSSMS